MTEQSEEMKMITVNVSCDWMESRARDAMIVTAAVEAFVEELETPVLGVVAKKSLWDISRTMWEDIQMLQCILPTWGEKCPTHAKIGEVALERFKELYPRIMIALGGDPTLPTQAYGIPVDDPALHNAARKYGQHDH